jgi:hypothetical protein
MIRFVLHRFAPRMTPLGALLAVVAGTAVPLHAEAASLPSHASNVAQAPAAAESELELLVLHATNDGKGIDPKLGKIEELTKPPFSAWNSYKLLERKTIKLKKGESTKVTLPTGELELTLKDVIPAKGKDPKKAVITASVTRGGKKVVTIGDVTGKTGERFFVAGQKHQGGELVLGFSFK